jgi:protein-tyrosine-phosphatase
VLFVCVQNTGRSQLAEALFAAVLAPCARQATGRSQSLTRSADLRGC